MRCQRNRAAFCKPALSQKVTLARRYNATTLPPMLIATPLIPAARSLGTLAYLRHNGLSSAAIARRINRSRSAVSRWVSERSVPVAARPALEALREEMERAA